MHVDELIGTWLLERFEVHGPSGSRQPFGSDARGVIVYGSDGWMSAVLSRTEQASGGGLERSHHLDPAAKAARFDGYLSYVGRWTIEGDEVLHHVEVALAPGVVGTVLRRRFELRERRLLLCYDLTGRSGVHRFELAWTRAPTEP